MSSTGLVDFSPLLAELEQQRDLSESIRERSKDLDRAFRSLSSHLNAVHSTPGHELQRLVERTQPFFQQCRGAIASIVEMVPRNQYYKWCDDWSFHLKNTTYAACLAYFLGTGYLLTKEDASLILGIDPAQSDRFMLSSEEYLHSLVSMINDMPRLAINSVTLGDFQTPVRLSQFVKELHAGFQLLNLKNDSLRKRFDGIKYDIKKIEEIVYDISLRGLVKPASEPDPDAHGVGVRVSEERRRQVLNLLSGDSQQP